MIVALTELNGSINVNAEHSGAACAAGLSWAHSKVAALPSQLTWASLATFSGQIGS